jgi:hypothetical protein
MRVYTGTDVELCRILFDVRFVDGRALCYNDATWEGGSGHDQGDCGQR